MTTPLFAPPMWVPSMDAFLSHWFPRYEDARAFRETEGGYLFPFGQHYFVTTALAVRELGLIPRNRTGKPSDSIGFGRPIPKRGTA